VLQDSVYHVPAYLHLLQLSIFLFNFAALLKMLDYAFYEARMGLFVSGRIMGLWPFCEACVRLTYFACCPHIRERDALFRIPKAKE
jgi:hypothetical protein